MFYIKTNLTAKIDRVNDSKLRDEYKLKAYTDYLPPSVRFVLSATDAVLHSKWPGDMVGENGLIPDV